MNCEFRLCYITKFLIGMSIPTFFEIKYYVMDILILNEFLLKCWEHDISEAFFQPRKIV